jgi:hypothetical protein
MAFIFGSLKEFSLKLLCTQVNLTLFIHNAFQGSKDDTKLRNRKNILILALTRHDDSLMLFQDF